MLDHFLPSCRFFQCSAGAAMRSRHRAVDAPQLQVDFLGVDAFALQSLEDSIQQTVGIPRIEQPINGLPWPKFLRQIAPRRAGPKYPEDCIRGQTPIGRRPSGMCWLWQQVFDQFPLFIRKSISGHSIAFLGKRGYMQRLRYDARNT